jgi:hypothetical protein
MRSVSFGTARVMASTIDRPSRGPWMRYMRCLIAFATSPSSQSLYFGAAAPGHGTSECPAPWSFAARSSALNPYFLRVR